MVKNRLHQTNYNVENELMTIVEYNKANDISVQFEDGTIRQHKTYNNFKKGSILKIPRIQNKNGEIGFNKQGLKMEIIEFNGQRNIRVKFENNYTTLARYDHFKTGNIKNPYFPAVCGVGFLGEGEFYSRKNGEKTKAYNMWTHMMKRCYGNNRTKKNLSYVGCTICEEWHNYQNFARWFEENYWHADFYVLDKDILKKGNRVYSPDTCLLVDNYLNMMFTNTSNRDKYGYKRKDNEWYVVNVSRRYFNQKSYIGQYPDAKTANMVYKQYKEQHIKQVANEYKEKYDGLPNKLYKALYNYQILY